MADVKQTIRRRGRRVVGALAPTAMDSVSRVPGLRTSVGDLEREVARLRDRVKELEAEVHETRRLQPRLAEITDVVQELLLPVDQRDQQRVDEQLKKFSRGL